MTALINSPPSLITGILLNHCLTATWRCVQLGVCTVTVCVCMCAGVCDYSTSKYGACVHMYN